MQSAIIRDPNILGGEPVFRETRVPFKILIEYLQGGETLEQFLQPLQVMVFDDAAAQAYGPARARLQALGEMIGSIDMLLAAQALSLDMTMVTVNVSEFRRVHGLRVRDWTKSAGDR